MGGALPSCSARSWFFRVFSEIAPAPTTLPKPPWQPERSSPAHPSSGDISAVDAHLANGGSVELRDASGATLLVVAAQAGQAVVLERLLAAVSCEPIAGGR